MFVVPKLEFNSPVILTWETEDFCQHLLNIDTRLFRLITPEVYMSLCLGPPNIEGAAFDGPLKIMLDYLGWFKMVIWFLLDRSIYKLCHY